MKRWNITIEKHWYRCYIHPNILPDLEKNINQVISPLRCDEVQQESPKASDLKMEKVFQTLQTTSLGQLVVYKPTVVSTQDLLYKEFTTAPTGTICIADLQTKGKGRGSNSWENPRGCLTFSFKSKLKNGQQLPFLQYLVSLALVQVVNQYVPNLIAIKWPNDIYTQATKDQAQMKIGGILCQSEFKDGHFHVTTGVGLNIDNANPTTCINALLQAHDIHVTREQFLAEFCNLYEPMEATFAKEGFQPYEKKYLDNWLHSNQKVVVKGEDRDTDTTAIIKGLTSSGCLLAQDLLTGCKYELFPDGNSFDFFSGLLKRKI